MIVGDLGYGTVHGIVTNATTGAPIAGAGVTCSHTSYTSSWLCSGMVVTDSTGAYVFNNVFFHDTDQITLSVTAPGYTAQTLVKTFFTTPNFTANFALAPTTSVTPTPTAGAGQPDLLYPATPGWVWKAGDYDSANSCYNLPPILVWNVQVKNAGSADAGSFVVNQNYSQQQTVPGLPAGQTVTLYFPFPGERGTAPVGQPTLSPYYASFMADYTNLVAESNETNNTTFSAALVVFTATPNSGSTRVFCKTATPGTPTLTPTRTPLTPTKTGTGRSMTPWATPTRTPTRTFTPTVIIPDPTPTQTLGCSPVTSSITAPFTYDGSGAFCWQSSNLGSYINSWNLTGLTVNGVNETNLYVAAGSLPVKIGGYWYVGYNSAVAWGHFEAK
jgi:hypothetical protein